MAQSVPEPAASPADAGEFAAEFERLAGRPATEAEREIARRVSSGSARERRAVWAEGLMPEGLAHLAVAISASEGKRVLFISPSADLLEHRQLRLRHRARTMALTELAKQSGRSEGATVWASPNQIEGSHLARAFGTTGPEVVIVEDAHAIVCDSFAFRPSMAKIKEIVARFPEARFVIAAPARGHQLRQKIGKALGLRPLAGKSGGTYSVIEPLVGKAGGPMLRVEADEADAIAAIVGPLPRPCLVLCSTPAQADQVYAHLEAEQVPVHRYHSGLSAAERARELVHFALPGRRAVMVAVSSFGPGTGFAGRQSDAVPEEFGHGYARRDLRSLVHLCAPCSLDQYAKELTLLAGAFSATNGDAGSESSDEGPSEERFGARPSETDAPVTALMLYNPAHLALNLALLERKRPSIDALGVAIEGLLRGQKGRFVPVDHLDPSSGTSPRSLMLVLDFLADLGVVEVRGGEVRATADVPGLREAQALLETAFEQLAAGDAPRLEEVETYALSETCRAQALRSLLGQGQSERGPLGQGQSERDSGDADVRCGVCDRCAPDGLVSAPIGARGQGAPTIETRPMKRRSPARPKSDTTETDIAEFDVQVDEDYALGTDT